MGGLACQMLADYIPLPLSAMEAHLVQEFKRPCQWHKVSTLEPQVTQLEIGFEPKTLIVAAFF